MKTFKILGSGCKKCATTADLIESRAKAAGIEIKIEKITDMATIMGYGVMSTPGVVIDETVVHAGGIPTPAQIEQWIMP